jgi:hypothetical protein
MAVNDLVDQVERPAFVRFEQVAFEDKRATLKAGRSVSKNVDLVYVTPPYTKEVFEAKWETWIANQERNVKNNRTPQAWVDHWKKAYAAFKKGQEAPLNGTPIKEWSAISPAQIKNLIAMHILTIEDLAGCNDEGLRRLGMGGRDLVNKAKNWIKSTEDHGSVTIELTELQSENGRLKKEIDTLKEQVKILKFQNESGSEPEMSEPMAEPSSEITASDIIDENLSDHNGKVEELKAKRESFAGETIDKLKFLHKERFGKNPHPKISRDKLIEKLLD